MILFPNDKCVIENTENHIIVLADLKHPGLLNFCNQIMTKMYCILRSTHTDYKYSINRTWCEKKSCIRLIWAYIRFIIVLAYNKRSRI